MSSPIAADPVADYLALAEQLLCTAEDPSRDQGQLVLAARVASDLAECARDDLRVRSGYLGAAAELLRPGLQGPLTKAALTAAQVYRDMACTYARRHRDQAEVA